ncbi:MAG: hypothetical protein ACK55I_11980, partial [bacterium]
GRHGADLGDELRRKRWIEIRPAGVGQRGLQAGRLLGEGLRVLLGDPGRGRPGLEVAEAAGVLLPGPVVVGRQHEHRGHEQHDRRHGERHVQDLEVPPGLFGCGHGGSACRESAEW